MNKEDIIRMAREAWVSDKEAQLITEFDEAYISCTYLQDLKKFAALVASAEREAILAVIGDNQCECRCSEVVRNRGQA